MKTDLRTRQGIERGILHRIESQGGVSVFWATATPGRASAIRRLEESGRIERLEGGQYPWCKYRVKQ